MISDEFTLLSIVRNTLTAKNHESVQVDSSDFDDCALIKIDEDYSFAISTDFVRGTGFLPFQRGYMTYYDVGWYLIGANLSDIASSGATPVGLTTAIRYGKNIDDEIFREIFEGMNDICKKYNTSIIGGDSGGYESDVFCATAFGKVETKKAMLRKNVHDGDVVCVTGNLGDAFACMAYLRHDLDSQDILTKDEEENLFTSWKRLEPRVHEGILLSKHCNRVACEDISDGFKATALQMSAISGKSFTFYEDTMPISKELKKVADKLDMDYLELAFSGSVDFELFCTMSRKDYDEISEIFKDKGYNLFLVGEVNVHGKNEIIRNDNTSHTIPGTEWKQQSGDFIKEITSKK